ncbi:MAG TPA: hypothetical protein VFZ48_01650 [Candidatus Saccharimonadales bacterium]
MGSILAHITRGCKFTLSQIHVIIHKYVSNKDRTETRENSMMTLTEWFMSGPGGMVTLALVLIIDTPVRSRISGLEAPYVGLVLTGLAGWIIFGLVLKHTETWSEDFWLCMSINAALFGTVLWTLWGTFRLALRQRPRAALL